MKRGILILGAVLITLAAAGQNRRMAVTALSEVQLREMPSYTAEMGTQALMGTVVEIVGSESYWRQVVTPEPYTAWCTELGLIEMTAEQINEYKAAPKYICVTQHSAVYSQPSAKSERLSDLSMGNLLRIVYAQTKKGEKPSLKKKAWAEVMLPDGRKGWCPYADLADFSVWAEKAKQSEQGIINTAKQFLGVPYLWGGTSSKGLDCSGLVRLTWMMNGYLLPRNAGQQAALGREIIMEANHNVAPDSDGFYKEMLARTRNLKPGDLIYFGTPESRWKKESITHVGIYIGDGRFIHASQVVRINSLIPGSKDYYSNSHKLLKARRLFDWKGDGMTHIKKSNAYFLQNQ